VPRATVGQDAIREARFSAAVNLTFVSVGCVAASIYCCLPTPLLTTCTSRNSSLAGVLCLLHACTGVNRCWPRDLPRNLATRIGVRLGVAEDTWYLPGQRDTSPLH